MKSITTTVIFAMLCTLAMSGCTKQGNNGVPQGKQAINLRARGSSVAVRGSVDQGSTFTASVAGWEGAEAANYGSAAKWYSTSYVTSSSENAAITLLPVQFYNESVSIKTFIRAWHPAVEPGADGKVTFPGIADGVTDVLVADQIWGTIQVTPEPLVFRHPLTQLKFKVVSGYDYDVLGNSLTAIVIKGAQLPVGLDLVTGEVMYASVADLRLPGLLTAIPIVGEAASAGAAVMVRPFDGNSLKVDIKTTLEDYNDVVVTISDDEKFVPGKAYTMTLTFTGKDVVIGATVDQWEEGKDSGLIVD